MKTNKMTVNPIMYELGGDSNEAKSLNKILMGHAAFQYLNAGCELKVFEMLYGNNGLNKSELQQQLNLEERPFNCLLLGLCSLELIVNSNGKYQNSNVINQMFKENFWSIFQDVVVFEQRIAYLGQYDFVESLKRNANVGLQRVEGAGETLYHRLNSSDKLQSAFYNYMSSWSKMSIPLLINSDVFAGRENILDVGGGDATNAIEIARSYPNAKISFFELQENCILAKNKILKDNLVDRIDVIVGDMFKSDFAQNYDCIAFIHQLVIWSKEQIIFLLKKAFNSLQTGGSIIIFSSIISDDESGPLFGALDSVYFMSIPANGGMIYPWKFYEDCLRSSGFNKIEKIRLNTWSRTV